MKPLTFWLLHFGLVLLKLFAPHSSFSYFRFVFVFFLIDAGCFTPAFCDPSQSATSYISIGGLKSFEAENILDFTLWFGDFDPPSHI